MRKFVFPLFLGFFSFPGLPLFSDGRADSQSFVVFDGLLFDNKPDLSTLNFRPCYQTSTEMWSGTWPNYNMERGDETAVRELARRMSPDVPVMLDIEHWPLSPPEAAEYTIDRMIEIIEWMRDENPELIIGYYTYPPMGEYYPPMQYAWLQRLRNTPGWTEWHEANFPTMEQAYFDWEAGNIRLQRLAQHVDMIMPSLYTYYNDPYEWELDAMMVFQAARQYGKPIYPWIWFQYHDSAPNPYHFIPVDFWRRQLEVCRRYADGVVIWGGFQQQWNPNAPWWQETLRFVSTLENTVYARDAGAVLDGVTDDSAALQAAIDSFPVSGGRLILDGVAGIGITGLRLQNKSNVVIQGRASSGGLKALGVGGASPTVPGYGPVIVSVENSQGCIVNGLDINANNFAIGGVGVQNSQKVSVLTNKIYQIADQTSGASPHAIVGIGNQNNKYEYNTITSVPVGVRSGSPAPSEIETGATISDNFISDVRQGDAIFASQKDISAYRNVIWDIEGSGIVLTRNNVPYVSNDSTAGRIVLKSNVVSQVNLHGIEARSVPGQASMVRDVLAESNRVEKTGDRGFSITTAEKWDVRGNWVLNTGLSTQEGVGILIANANNISITNTDVACSRYSPTLGFQKTGIGVFTVDPQSGLSHPVRCVTLADNTLRYAVEDSIKVFGLVSGLLEDVEITRNQILGNARYGVYVRGSATTLNQISIFGNSFSENDVRDIYFEDYTALSPTITAVSSPSPRTVQITFEGIDGSDSYHLQVSQDSQFASLYQESSAVTSPLLVSLNDTGRFHFRIRGRIDQGAGLEYSRWSNTQDFLLIESNSPNGGGSDTGFGRFQNIFNPSKQETCPIKFSLSRPGVVQLFIYDRRGNEIIKLWDDDLPSGVQTIVWDGRNSSGDLIGAGVYRAYLKANGKKLSTGIVLVK